MTEWRVIRLKSFLKIRMVYENGKMRPVETIPGMGKGWIKGMNSAMIQWKYFGKYHNVPPVQ
jgi:hypothetical protein